MALRVLLADESTTIKKVMQLALQDFGVEVKAVPNGLDVITVAESFNPNIIFVDVLLTKKTGYEVCGEIKDHAQLKKVPTVLMWSGFMDLDEAKASACRADRRLEKPFDSEILRNLVKDLVPTLSGNKISEFLTFPELPQIIEDQKIETVDLDEPDDFQQVSLASDSANLDRFKINLPQDAQLDESVMNFADASIELSSGQGEIQISEIDGSYKPQIPTQQPKPVSTTFGSSPAAPAQFDPATLIDPAQIEQIVTEHVRSVLQEVAWKIVPDVTERVVREELQKLLKESERLS